MNGAGDALQEGLLPTAAPKGGLGAGEVAGEWQSAWQDQLIQLGIDAALSVVFWFVLLNPWVPLPSGYAWHACQIGLLVAMILWRYHRVKISPDERLAATPYTCGIASSGGREVFLVATVHISPRSPKDVREVIDTVKPDCVMIELDEERLERMREVPAADPDPLPEELQQVRLTQAGGAELFTFRTQRAYWNAEHAGSTITGDLVYEEHNQFGLETPITARGHVLLVRRGSPDGNNLKPTDRATFTVKCHTAAAGGASALMVMDTFPKLPSKRIGGGGLRDDLRIFMGTKNCGYPPIPVMLVSTDDSRSLLQSVENGAKLRAEIDVMPDNFPRRTLRCRLCQAAALMCSGIGILYGIIQCAGVVVGDEFMTAEAVATKLGLPCACIDVDMNRFWARIGAAVVPTPCNIAQSLLAWLALPRTLWNFLFPPRGSVDSPGMICLHATSLPLKTWLAFALAALGSSLVMGNVLGLFSAGAASAVEESGKVPKADYNNVQPLIMLGIELYMLPRLYASVAASRDEAMYTALVGHVRKSQYRRMVVVVGAGHANGILQRVTSRGL